MFFVNRCEAGRRLAQLLLRYRGTEVVVLGLPRGGVVVAYEVARALGAPLNLLVVRKLGAPDRPELAIGAVAPGVTVLDQETIRLLSVPDGYVQAAIERERREVERRLAWWGAQAELPELRDRTAIIADDGIATGSTALAALDAVRQRGAGRVVIAAPVCAAPARELLRTRADEVVCVHAPVEFGAVGYWYEDFTQVSDEEVRQILKRATLERQARFRPS